MKYFIAEVRDLRDPWETGRVKIRVYGRHDDEQNIKDDHLPWAMPLQPITSAATQKIGSAPVGMIVGSRVMGYWLDEEEQYPVIVGTFARAGKLKDEKDNTKGYDNIDNKYNDVPSHALNPEQQILNPYHKVGKKEADKDKERWDPSPDAQKYNKAKHKSNDEGDELTSKARETYSDSKELKTIASISKDKANGKGIFDMIKQVDSSNLSGAFGGAPDGIKKLLSLSNQTSGSGLNGLVGGGLGNVMQQMSGQFGIDKIMKMFNQGMGNSGAANQSAGQNMAQMMNQVSGYDTSNPTVEAMSKSEKEQLYRALLQLHQNATADGTVTQPTLTYYETVQPQPTQYPVVSRPPEGYFEVFSFSETDPYPGYKLWESPDGLTFVFTERPKTEPYSATPDEAVMYAALQILIDALFAMAERGEIDWATLLSLLGLATTAAQQQGQNNALGQGSGSGGNSNGMQQILGQLGQFIQKAKSQHLPNSVLDQSKMNQTLEGMQKQMAIAKQKKEAAKQATAQPNDKPKANGLVAKNNDAGTSGWTAVA